MKITKVCLQCFRAFDERFELDLGAGRCLLLYGENGSGKSSIYLALKRFFEERGDDINNHRNCFSPRTRDPFVRIHLKGAYSGATIDQEFYWDVPDGHPLPVPKNPATAPISPALRAMLVDAAHRSGFLDYRAMLRTHLLSGPLPRSSQGATLIHNIIYGATTDGLSRQLFDLVSFVILAGTSVTIGGGTPAKIGDLIRDVWKNPPAARYKKDLDTANNFANTFSAGISAKLQELENKLTGFLNYFDNHALAATFGPVSMSWDKKSLSLDGAELRPEIRFRGEGISDHHQILNEARLSALAICLFLAGVALADNDYSNPNYPRFLFLDDALIGLDLQHRLPVLEILKSKTFKHYQIFLFTHDRVWFDLARAHLPEKNGWYHRELLADESTGSLVPKWKPSRSDVDVARQHLANGDLKAAAVYARSAFEWKLRKTCEDYPLKIPFKRDASKIDANTLWTAITDRQKEVANMQRANPTIPNFIPPALENDVEVMRSNVLNKLSHAGASSLVTAEVRSAVDTVERLIAHNF